MANIDLQNRSPRAETLPDMRRRITRIYDCLNNIPKDPAELLAKVWLPWGTQDAEFEDCRLVQQNVSGQDGAFRKPVDEPPQLVRVFEEIPAAPTEQIVGAPAVTLDQYQNEVITIDYIAFSAGTATYQIPGTTAAPAPFTTAILKTEERTNDGTLFRIRRIYTTGGLLADNEDLKFGGRLKIRTQKWLNPSAPPTISGYTLITTSTEYVRGLELVSYGFAAGGGGGGTGTGGIISTEIVYHESSDEGSSGVTVETIRFLTDLSVVANPITTPSGFILISIDYETDAGYKLWTGVYAKGIGEVGRDITYGQTVDGGATGTTTTTITHLTASSVSTNPTSAPGGSTLVGLDHREADGYRIWTVRYGAGTGMVVDDVEIKEGACLYLYHRVALNAPPSTPSGTIGGPVTLISTDVRQSDGYTIYDYRWAEGRGFISIEYSSGEVGADGIDPETGLPVVAGWAMADVRYLSGEFTTNPVTSSPIPGGVQISSSFVMQDGYRVWSSRWGFGVGTVVNEIEYKDNQRLILYHRIALGSPPSTPSANIGGTVTLISAEIRNAGGYVIYDDRWAEGKGTIDLTTRPREDGSIEHVVITLSAAAELPAAPGFPGSFNYSRILAGTSLYCIALKTDAQDGYYLNTATWIEPPTNRSTEKRTVKFTVPGLATAANPPTFSPPISRHLLATVFETWGTTPNPNSDVLYTVASWASLDENYKVAATGQQVSNITALDGYLGSSSDVGSNTNYRGIDVTSFAVAVGGSSPTTPPSGLTVLALDWEPYLTDINGVIVWKTTSIKYTF